MFRSSIALAAILIVTASSTAANASRSRLTSLGQGSNGSLFIQDNRNLFLNPAMLNFAPSHVNFEFGPTNPALSTNAEGGITQSLGDFKLGLQLGRTSDATLRLAAADTVLGLSTATDQILYPQNSLDLTIAGEAGIAWGAGVHFARSKNDVKNGKDAESSAMLFRGGIQTGSIEAYGAIDLAYEVKESTPKRELKGKPSFEFGGAFAINETAKVGARLNMSTIDYENGATEGELSSTGLSVLYYNELPTKEGVLLFYTAGLNYQKVDNKIDNAPNGDSQITQVPLTIGVEADANSWMKLRASVAQAVVIDIADSDTGTVNTKTEGIIDTTVIAGAGFNFADFTLDGAIEGTIESGPNKKDASGKLNGNSLLAQVGLTYNF